MYGPHLDAAPSARCTIRNADTRYRSWAMDCAALRASFDDVERVMVWRHSTTDSGTLMRSSSAATSPWSS